MSNMTTLTHVNLDVSLRDEISTKKKRSSNLEPIATLETKRVKVLFQLDMFNYFFSHYRQGLFLAGQINGLNFYVTFEVV